MGALRARLSGVAERLTTSLWFVPALMTLSAAGAGLALVHLRIDIQSTAWWLHQGDGRDASELLSSLLGSMITVATLVISITMVVLTLAAGQLGPRLIPSFMRDPRTQVTLGLFVASITYLVVVLRSLDGGMAETEVPHAAVTGGTALVLASTFALLFYVHHLARSIIADTMIKRVGDALDDALDAAFGAAGAEPIPDLAPDTVALVPLAVGRSGYVQSIDYEALVRCAEAWTALVALDLRAGDHVISGERRIRGSPSAAADPAFVEAVRGAVLVGGERTQRQDPEFPARQLVEIALRALSPSLNDPFTAIAAVDRLSASIALVCSLQDPRTAWFDGRGSLRLVASAPSFASLVDVAFSRIRRSATDHPDVLRVLDDRLEALEQMTGDRGRRRVLRRHRIAVQELLRRAG